MARDIQRFKGGEDELRRWVFTIARNRLIDARRRVARRPQIDSVELPDTPGRAAPEPLDPALIAALFRLTEDQREVVALRFVADLSLDEVARITKRKVGAVKALQQRGISQLGRILGVPVDAEQIND